MIVISISNKKARQKYLTFINFLYFVSINSCEATAATSIVLKVVVAAELNALKLEESIVEIPHNIIMNPIALNIYNSYEQ